jgi:DNA-directed RNA polymerase specialized sigma24 family protein
VDGPVKPVPDRRKPRRARHLNDEQVQDLVAGYVEGASVYELGERFGIDRRTVSKILRRHGVGMRRQGLTPKQAEDAVRLYEAGWSLERIGARMKVGSMTVHRRLREQGVKMRDAHRPKR